MNRRATIGSCQEFDMSKYRVAIVSWPEGWTPCCPDDVPTVMDQPIDVLAEADEVFDAVAQAAAYNAKAIQTKSGRWAVVTRPGSAGRIWRDARLCTPLRYKVATIWWPEGWEPASPLDVPNCTWQAQYPLEDQPMSYRDAENAVHALNRQCMDSPSNTWYVLVAVENEPLSRSVALDAAGSETTVEVRQLHVIRPQRGGRGDCSYCPGHSFSCAEANWTSQSQTMTVSDSKR
jgi:hypothetical protein